MGTCKNTVPEMKFEIQTETKHRGIERRLSQLNTAPELLSLINLELSVIESVTFKKEISYTFSRSDFSKKVKIKSTSKKSSKGKIYLQSSVNEQILSDFQLIIVYDPRENLYKIKSKNRGTGVFKGLESKSMLEDENYIIFGNNHLIITKYRSSHVLKLQFVEGEFKDSTFIDDPDIRPCILFGRDEQCHYFFDDKTVSRIQLTLQFEDNEWYLCDGGLEKKSVNGNWILIDDFHTITEETKLKSGSSTFLVKLIEL